MELPLEVEFGKVVAELHWALNNKANSVLAAHGITVEQVKMLHFIQTNPGCEQNFLAEVSKKTKSAITKLINKMSDEGLVARATSKEDARTNAIYATDKGVKLSIIGRNVLTETLSDLFKEDKTELTDAINSMKRITQRLA